VRYGFSTGVTSARRSSRAHPYAREPRKLPVVLSADEVVQFLEAVSSLKSRAALTTAYAAGLRASEVAGLRNRRHRQRPRRHPGAPRQGAKERNVMLSPQFAGASCAPTGGSPAAALSVPWS